MELTYILLREMHGHQRYSCCEKGQGSHFWIDLVSIHLDHELMNAEIARGVFETKGQHNSKMKIICDNQHLNR